MWEEKEHPRDKQGRFTKKDFADMSADELKEYILKKQESNNNLLNIVSSEEIDIGRSLGAEAFRDVVLLPNGRKGRLKENSKIIKVVTFAGKGTSTPIKIANVLSKIHKQVTPDEWQKRRGEGFVVCDDGQVRCAELHWFESTQTGRIQMKVKRYFT